MIPRELLIWIHRRMAAKLSKSILEGRAPVGAVLLVQAHLALAAELEKELVRLN